MNLLNTSYTPNSYDLEIKHSILFECALGIAMITYPKLHEKLEKPKQSLDALRNSVSEKLEADLQYCQEHNTWKMLLQLLHVQDFENTHSFVDYINGLEDQTLIYLVLPFLDESQQQNRMLASKGDKRAAEEMILASKGHQYFPQMIHFISEIEPAILKKHLVHLMTGWYNEILLEEKQETEEILKRDYEKKINKRATISNQELVQLATGIEYKPESNIAKVILVPHISYRPWTIEANLEGTKIFYYPVSNESLIEHVDINQPPPDLVQLFKALGDEKRLTIMRYLSQKERSLKELTELLDIGKTTVHHHLTILRTAHIVGVKGSVYSIKMESILKHEQELIEYLERRED
ncbi:metalloregulator ArsR/SmtB family transcription factor [Bacillus sp. CECT 9360]|uniref:ArsR/SmtB family transcription factor n=1 Tax=Bacillus sp. CECT 9360 TaxID=2845821 RepID=UPI001E539BF5|nr:metalloregulator ArsR/SmtB family transcription factor [Bacillus sp. CECT 9360]CAH0343967.1 hypothetical protein BCI9360_00195 [Bacillus sp. CECT 9360]